MNQPVQEVQRGGVSNNGSMNQPVQEVQRGGVSNCSNGNTVHSGSRGATWRMDPFRLFLF